MARQGVIYLTIAEARYNQKVAFVFLSELAVAFQDELRNTYGTTGNVDYRSKIETVENAYAFIKFGKWLSWVCVWHVMWLRTDRIIQKKKKEFRDDSAQENLDKLN